MVGRRTIIWSFCSTPLVVEAWVLSSRTFSHRTSNCMLTMSHCRIKSRPTTMLSLGPYDQGNDNLSTITATRTNEIPSGSFLSSSSSQQVPPQALADLFSPPDSSSHSSVSLPYRCDLTKNLTSTKTSSHNPAISSFMELRLLQLSDIPQVANLCYQEYGKFGSGSTAAKSSSTGGSLSSLGNGQPPNQQSPLKRFQSLWNEMMNVLEDVCLIPLLYLALTSKWFLCTMSMATNNPPFPKDHVVLVLELGHESTLDSTDQVQHNKNREDNKNLPSLVGVVDLSLHEVRPDRRTPFFPQLFLFGSNPREPWVTNVLIAPTHRGQGWSKVLLGGCEWVARNWLSSYQNHHQQQTMEGKAPSVSWSMHLHCDAHPKTGRIAQQLYLSLGYQPTSPTVWVPPGVDHSETATMFHPPQLFETSIHIIDDVPLLYMSKPLVEEREHN